MINQDIYRLGLARFIVQNGGRLTPLFIDLPGGREISCMNPSILHLYDDRFLINLRVTNYFLWNSKKFLHTEGPVSYCHGNYDPNLRSENYLIEMNSDFKTLACHKVELNDSQEKHEFIGLEDIKLVDWDLYTLLGSRRDDNSDGKSRMHLVCIDNECKKVRSKRLEVPNESYLEKNWIPILDKPHTYIRNINTWNIVKYIDHYETLKPGDLISTKEYRGSSQLIPIDDHYLAIIHTTEVIKPAYGKKDAIYKHYFMKVSKDLNEVKISDPFTFMPDENVEFCNGLAYNIENGIGYLYIPFSTSDNVSYIAKIEYERIFK